MKTAIQEIGDSLLDDLCKNIEAFKNGKLAESSPALNFRSSGSKEFTFHLDDKGQYVYKFSAYGAGITIDYTLAILNPEAIYCITVKSSDGGGGVYTNVRANQRISGTLKTSFWHSTTLTVAVEANITNAEGTAKMDYSY